MALERDGEGGDRAKGEHGMRAREGGEAAGSGGESARHGRQAEQAAVTRNRRIRAGFTERP